jgi:hypothetical protein
MSKHSLISVGLGLGLMAASMGASAQLHTFDYSMVYYTAASGGAKYTMFVPTAARAAAGVKAAASVIMLDFFQPSSGTTNSWAFALGGAVNAVAGGAGANAGDNSSGQIFGAANGAKFTETHYFGDNIAIGQSFLQQQTISSQVCNITFSASIGTNDQLLFNNVNVRGSDFSNTANADVTIFTTGAAPGANVETILQAAWNNQSVTLRTYAASVSFQVSGLATSISSGTNSAFAVSSYNALVTARNKCVPAYTARAAGFGTSIDGVTPLGMIRVF